MANKQAARQGLGKSEAVARRKALRLHGAIARDLKCELEEVYEAAKLISTLEPRPGRNFTTEDPPYITPDVYVHKTGDEKTMRWLELSEIIEQ